MFDAQAPIAPPPDLAGWLRRAARQTPQACAVEAPDGQLSYAELLDATDALARDLHAAGFSGGDRVGIAATRSTHTVVAILAAIEAGIGYVPLDLAYPAERLRAMLQDAQPRAVLGEAEALSALVRSVGEVPTLSHPAPAGPALHAAAADLAYVLFTSGSTGRPKGVAMGRTPLAHLIAFHAAHPRLGQAARTLQFAPLSFDVHFQEIFSTLACGGTLVLLTDAQRRDPALLHAALRDLRIERLFAPYVALQMVAETAGSDTPPALREVVSAGEQLQITPAIRSFFARLPQAELHNHYGPTESHVVTAFELRGDAARWPDIPPIGTPLPHVRLALHACTPDSAIDAGDTELLIGGDTLAHGYLGRPDLTDERFRTNFDGLPGRWYATGDLARREADGSYVYLGRADQQLKVDGFRIEAGEVELALMRHAAVKEAVVTAPEIPGAGRQLTAHVVPRTVGTDTDSLARQLRAHLRGTVPEHMLPLHFVLLDRLPTTPSGKIDRRALPLPSLAAPASVAATPLEAIRSTWQALLGLAQLGDAENLFDLGARSLLVLRFVARMRALGFDGVSVADVYDRPTVAGIATALQSGPAPRRTAKPRPPATTGVAIVGMATRTPGAGDVEAFWQNLLAGREGIRHFSPDELDASVPTALRTRPNFVAARGVLDDADRFDAAFFGIPAREALVLDPQQRLLLELCWTALEQAAIDPSRGDARIGVYAGSANNSYIAALRQAQPELVQQYGEFATMLASEKDYVATRIANKLNLNGPAVSVHTACSTGLVAVAQAWQALASGQCDVALAGGATVMVPQAGGYLHVEGGMESADGHCRPFDADASGTVFASGGGVVVLKRLDDALADGDTVYAVIRGVGLNNDGGDKASFTAPSVSGQAGAIRMALDHAQVDARSIGYVEAHGTATSLGDPIEVAALTRAWGFDTTETQFCGLGSLKGNLGHMVAAAGVVGLVKAALSLQREVIPGTLHFRQPNPQIDFTRTPFHVLAENTPWPRTGDAPRRAAVSSFGVGGTNAHVVLEEAPASAASSLPAAAQRLWLLPLSGRTPEAAVQRARALADHLDQHPQLPLADVAATLVRGRQAMARRLSVVAASATDAARALRAATQSTHAAPRPRVVFVFPGQGSQHPGMARRLYDEAPAFRDALDACLALAQPALGVDLGAWLIASEASDAEAAEHLSETRFAQPALFSMSYALAAWLDSLGIEADAMIGHSIGEYTAACRGGVMSLADAMAAVVARGQAMFAQPHGAMLAVRTGADALQPLLPAEVEIAGCNAPALTVVAGSAVAIDALAQRLEAQHIGTTALRVSHAFHSASMDTALPQVEQALRQAQLQPPRTTVYSCITGAPLQAADATDPRYWARQVRAPVQFSRAVQAELAHEGDTVFVEVGPGQALTALLRQHRTTAGTVPRTVALLGPAHQPGDPALQALSAVGQLWCAGVDVAWPVPATARRVPLPTYPFAGERHWFSPSQGNADPAVALSAPLPVAPEASAIAPDAPLLPAASRLHRIEQELQRVLSDVSGLPAQDMAADASFVDLGLDSLSLTQATLELERVFGVKLRFRRLLEDLDRIGTLAQFLDTTLPADRFAPPAVAAPVPTLPSPLTATGGPATLQQLHQQMQWMAQQLAALAGQPAPASTVPPPQAPAPMAVQPGEELATSTSLVDKPFGASPRLTLQTQQAFTPAQRDWLNDFIARYNARSGRSKAFSQDNRSLMADPRVVTGFNPLWKDLVYPIVVDRSKGAHLWDLDGNAYIDLLSGFGANLLGYQPDDVVKAMTEQLQSGIEIGPQHPLSAEVAGLISEFTGMARVAFCNTGSEAVMGAMRIARTVTGRKTIAIFTNSYHGIFDEVIVRGTKQLRSLSAAPGILANAVENVLVLDYASDEALRVLKERGPELAAIMIEPIQNKLPTLQPREFVQSLRRIADDAGCALIFDEVVTGFRVAPGGAQEFYGVRADIATYGKIIGGGLPFAAIAGGSHWLDALDGGHWQYGDDSYPEAGVTYFAGTFVRHPLALAAARATLLHLKRGGRALYQQLNARTQRLAERLNTAFAVRGAPVKAVHCASLWRLAWDDQKHVSLFYYLARHQGLHLYEQFGHFMTEPMGDAETDRIFAVFTGALDELMALGFITPRQDSPPPSAGPDGDAEPTGGPLSPGQTERWLAGAFDPAARRALNESFCIGLRGAVDRDALKAALQDVLMRHAAFRIAFDTDQPLQTVMPCRPVPVAEVDLRGQDDADAALDAFCTQASERDFPWDQAPLAAVSLLQLADGRVVVHVVASHLVFDGWAASVFSTELAAAYRARSLGLPPHWEPAASPLRFAALLQQKFDGDEGAAALRHWQALLQSPPAPLALGDRQPPTPRRYTADTLRLAIGSELLAALRARARRSGATLFQLLLAAVTLMLRQRSGQAEFVVSIPYAGQGLQQQGPLMADGVLDLPLRLGGEALDSPEQVLRHVRGRLLDALEFPLMTQGTVARALGLRSSGDRPPLTGIYFNLNPRVDVSAYAPLQATMHEGRKRGTLSELFFNFHEQDDTLTLDLHHSSELFSPGRAQELVDALHAQCVAWADLATAATAPSLPSRPLAAAVATRAEAAVPRPEPDARLRQWNDTEVALAPGSRVEDWVAHQAAATPDALAVLAHGTALTYQRLESRACRWAHLLRQRGVGAGHLVGVCLSRGIDLVPALLGVLKTGAAYVPLDPGFPRERLRHMAQDAGLALVITEAAHADLAGLPRAQQLRVDDDAALVAAASDAPLPPPDEPVADAPAYVIYTSGSTGLPKGVAVPQQAVCNFLASMQRAPGLAASNRLLAVTTLSFDIAVLELFLPLTVGATCVLAERGDAMDGEALARLISEHRINVMQATPTTWHLLLDAQWQAPAGFRALCGGEALPPSLAARLLAAGVELWNMYGPTETTVWSTLARITDATQPITIGRPIANTQVWVLDAQGAPCPIGTEGELCIGGAGVALGYFQRPELTAERFITDPFSPAPGARLYRTGDLARWREDGQIEHLGRMDFQVKIRGYRIELGEIEARLSAVPGVARCVVMAREDQPGDVRLVAYAVPQATAVVQEAAVRDALRPVLPDYMLPQHVVVLDALPLLPNGKINRQALPPPTGPAPGAASASAPPRTDLERTLAEAMRAVLNLAQVGVDDDFFSLGGHSLLAARLVGQINRALGLQLNLRTLFESPTVVQLAQAIVQIQAGGAAAPQRPPIVRHAQQDTAPLTLMQERIQLVEQMQPGRVAYNAPSGHRFTGPMDTLAFDRAFNEMVRRQGALRTAIVRSGDGFVQQVTEWTPGSLLPAEDLSLLPPDSREAVLQSRVEALAAETFALDQAPLFKARLFKLGDQEHALFFMPHHVVWDGWSFDILYAEMSALYDAFLNDRPSPLPDLPVSYGDFARWHADWLRSDEIRQQIDFWKRQFALSPEPLQPPADLPRRQPATGRGASESMHIPRARAEQIRDIAKQTGSTLSIVSLSVYAALMSQWLGDPVPAIGMPVRGRPLAEVENLMGFFNNMLPLRLPVDLSLTCRQWIKAVRQSVTEAFAHQDVPFELLAQELQSTRLYQAMFSFQDARQRQTHWGPLAHERIPVMQKGTTEDINLWMVEIPGGIEGGLQYNADLFLPSTAAALRDRFLALLERLVENPEQSVAELLAVRPAEHDTLTEWDQTLPAALLDEAVPQPARPPAAAPMPALPPPAPTARPANTSVDPLAALAARLAAPPDRCAVHHGEQRLSWAELDRRLRQAEAALQPVLAAAPAGCTVVVAMSDTAAQLVAGLAALRSGRPCLALPAALPLPARHAAVAQQGGAVVWVGDGPDPMHTAPQVTLMAAPPSGGAPRAMPQGGGMASSLAIDRHALAGLCAALLPQLSLSRDRGVLCMDGSVRPLLWLQGLLALARGATVVLAPAELARDGLALGALLHTHRVGWMHASAATWRRVLMATRGSPLSLTAQVDVTESTPELVQLLLAADCRVLAVYRPAALGLPLATGRLLAPTDHALFGRPLLPGVIEMTDRQGRPVPAGMTGALQLHWPDTAVSALPTGSLARWRSDGVLQYMGEAGRVLHVEGERIDCAVLEARLSAHPQVADCAVLMQEDRAGAWRLRIYVVPQGTMPDTPSLRDWLDQSLPLNALHLHVFQLAAIARLANGQPDRNALPRPAETLRDADSQALGQPASATEAAIAEIWQDLLGLDEIGMTDNFFALGGHSMLAMQVVVQLEKRLSKKLPLTTLVEAPTIRQLAQRISGPMESDAPVLLRAGGDKPPVFFVHDGDGETLLYRTLAHHLDAGHPVYGLQPHAANGFAMLHTRIADMAAYHVRKIREVQPEGPYLLAGLCAGGVIAFEIAQQLQQQGQAAAMLALIDAADMGAARHRGRVISQRVKRFTSTFHRDASTSLLRSVGQGAVHALRKARNFLAYEAHTLVATVSVKTRVLWLRRCLDRGQTPPDFLRSLTVRQIYLHAERHHSNPQKLQGNIALFRATKGRGTMDDESFIDIFSDPLFGWQHRVHGTVESFDVPGGHSSMLQEPNVRVMAEKMQGCIDDALASGSGATPGQAPDETAARQVRSA